MTEIPDDLQIDTRLRDASPEVSARTADSGSRLRDMISDAEQRASVKPRKVGLIVSGALAATLLLVGAGALPGVTDVFAQSSPVQVRLFEDAYSLPSGARCEAAFGVFASADPDAVEFIREYARTTSMVADADVDSVIADMRATPDRVWISPGVYEQGGYGTKYYDADSEYGSALERAVLDLEAAVLLSNGFAADALGPDSWSEHSCPDATWSE